MKANLPRFLQDSLPVEYREGIEERDRLADELTQLDAHLDWIRKVARSAGVTLEQPTEISTTETRRLEAVR